MLLKYSNIFYIVSHESSCLPHEVVKDHNYKYSVHGYTEAARRARWLYDYGSTRNIHLYWKLVSKS